MAGLTKIDFKVLLGIENDKEEYEISEEDGAAAMKRLIKAGMVDEEGFITVEGIEKAEQIRKALDKLRHGVPFSERKKADPHLVKQNPKWFTASVDKKSVTTDGSLIFVGRPSDGMAYEPASNELKIALPKQIAMQEGDYVEVKPFAFQTDGKMDSLELIWLVGNGVQVAMQGMYYDFIVDKYRLCKFFAANQHVAIKVVKKGAGITNEDIVAVVMPYLPEDGMPEIKVANG